MTKTINPSFVKLVRILNDGEYHDGDTLGQALDMTRSAIWKAIKKLEKYNVLVNSVKGKGYALREPLVLLNAAQIKKNLNEKIDLSVFESITSTSSYLKQIKNSKSILICLAEEQTQGKGRLGREWYSPFGKNIYLSCLYPFEKDISELAGLSLVMSLAILKTLKGYGFGDELVVKWPNDILYQHKKLAGILVDIQAETHGLCQAVIGVGLNVNIINDDNEIDQQWTSMQKILNQYIDRNELATKLINSITLYLRHFSEDGFLPFMDEWSAVDGLSHQVITLKNMNEVIKGKVTGINELGHLLLRMSDGTIRNFSSGDTSIVKK